MHLFGVGNITPYRDTLILNEFTRNWLWRGEAQSTDQPAQDVSSHFSNENPRALRIPKTHHRTGSFGCQGLVLMVFLEKASQDVTLMIEVHPQQFNMKHMVKIWKSWFRTKFKTSFFNLQFWRCWVQICQSCCRKSCFKLAGLYVVLDSLPWIPTISTVTFWCLGKEMRFVVCFFYWETLISSNWWKAGCFWTHQ